MTANYSVMNQGGAAAGASTIRYYFSTNNALDTNDTPVGERAIPVLAAGLSSSGTIGLQIRRAPLPALTTSSPRQTPSGSWTRVPRPIT